MIPQLDLTRQHAALREELLAAAARVLDSSRFILGPEGRALESELAAFCGARHGVGVNSGTDALLLGLRALGIGHGDEVITSAFSFVASASTILLVGATPVFVDVEPDTLNLAPALVEQAITPRTRAVVPVHLYGHVANMAGICQIARARGIAVLADAAQAIGATHMGGGVGAWGDAVCLSFYPTKNVGACGDGGMLLTSRDDLAERARRLRDHGSARRYEHVELGLSSRLDELQAAFLRIKLARLPEWNRRRRHVAARYRSLLAGLPIELPAERQPEEHVYHQFTIRVPRRAGLGDLDRRDALARALADLGIGTTVHYPMTIPAQRLFARADAAMAFPEATIAAREVLSLPCFPELTDDELEQVAAGIRTSLARLAA
jgi:dTDP-4-amino-4,6-dideoxygalactose transaminase